MTKLVMLRHGESIWNKKNLFTGWVDVPLSEKGMEESMKAGELIKNIPIDLIFTSSLIRAQMTAVLAMMHHSSGKVLRFLHPGEGKQEAWSKIYSEEALHSTIPVIKAWELNERMYGALQGLNKKETADKFGAAQVQIWRRSFAIAPPEGESLEVTAQRSIPYFKEKILPRLQNKENVLIAAHGNSLRSIIMEIDRLSQDEVVHLELATGHPIVYNFHDNQFQKTH